MTTTHELTLDLHKKGELQRIDVVQGDAGTRLVELTLEASGGPWEIPAEAQPAVRYLKPDGSSGVYDQLSDGGSAFRFDGNVLTMELAPQLLTCAGPVQVQVELSYQEQRIATFTFLIVVEQAVAMDGETGDYVNWTKIHLPQVTEAEQGQYLQITQVDEAGRVLELMPVDDPAAEVKAQIPTLESHILAVGQRVEDVSIDMADTIDLVSKAVIGPDTAKVGQILAVKTPGGNGRLLECEAIDLPTGGSSGGDVWETIVDYTVPEDCMQVMLKTDLNGNPFSLKRAILTCLIYPLAEPASWPLRCIFDSEQASVYSPQHFWSQFPNSPSEAGKCTGFRLDVCKTNNGISIINAERIQTPIVIANDGDFQMIPMDVYQRYQYGTLSPIARGITAVGIGSYKLSIGAGTRIVVQGVRE